jgi:hypothetical protein
MLTVLTGRGEERQASTWLPLGNANCLAGLAPTHLEVETVPNYSTWMAGSWTTRGREEPLSARRAYSHPWDR